LQSWRPVRRVAELGSLGGIARFEIMTASSKTKIRLWQLLLAILMLSFGLVYFTSERFSILAVIVIEAALLVTLVGLYLGDFLRWWRRQ
jgi:hypothetical protein